MIRSILFLVLCFYSFTSFGQIDDGYEIIEYNDLSYVSDSKVENDNLQRLNLVIPVKEGAFPMLIWIGGGAWSYVDKDMEMDLARNIARRGIAVASVGHQLSSAVWRDPKLDKGIQHPQHIEDIASATKWLLENTTNYNYHTDNLFIGGYSSGAHLAALLCLDSKYLVGEGLSVDIFKGMIPVSGAYDIKSYHDVFLNGERPELAEQHVEAVFGAEVQQMIEASPTSYLENLSIPMLLMCDNNLYNYTKLFEDRIRETDFRDVRVVYAYNFSHTGLWRDLSSENESFYRDIIIEFIVELSEL